MQDFLDTIGASTTATGGSRCADEPENLADLDHSSIITPLSHYGLLTVTGPDGAKFLQGQLTCNVADATASHSVAGAFCTPKGRMLASMQLAQHDPHTYWLRLRRDIVDSTAASLSKYIVFSKARLDIATQLIPLGLHGAAAAAAVRTLTGRDSGARYSVTTAEGGGLVLQLDDAGQWFECWLPQEQALAFWQQNQAHFRAVGTHYWQWLNIRAGLAEVCAATVDLFIPQMLNYQVTGAVNFKKGCYTGQEIVARTQYRGQIKRHMYRLAGALPTLPPAADLIANGQKIGTVVDSVQVDAETVELLAVLAESGPDQLGAAQPALRLLELPYAIT